METLKLDQSIGYRYCYLISVRGGISQLLSLSFLGTEQKRRESRFCLNPFNALVSLGLSFAVYCIEWIVIVSQLHFPKKRRLLFSFCFYSEKILGY